MHISNIAEKIVELVSPIVEIFKLQAETDVTPYAVYEILNEQPFYTKKRVYKWEASVSIYIVADKENTVTELKDQVLDVLPDRDCEFKFKIENISSARDDNQWAYKIDYTVTQFI